MQSSNKALKLNISNAMIRQAPEQSDDCAAHIEILSNLSLSLDRLAGFFLVLSAVTLLVALWPTMMGFWPIMLVAVIHLAIVGWCFRLAWRGHWARQDIFISAETTTIEYRSRQVNKRVELPTQWLRVVIEQKEREPHLYIAEHNQRIEIGAFLPADERLTAAKFLRTALAPFSAWHSA